MARDFNNSQFTRFDAESAEDADPRVGLVNLADVMLVFACGLMLAVVAAWNVDVSSVTEIMQTELVTEVEGIEALQDELGGGSGYEELGLVYQDPMTGKLYMLEKDLSGEDSATAREDSSSSGSTASDTTTPGSFLADSSTDSSSEATE